MKKKNHRKRTPCEARHALAIARWEDNRRGWLEGDFLGLNSRARDLQELIGDGGTLWIIVSRGQKHGLRQYSLSFRLDGCRKKTYRSTGRFGKFAVIGDPDQSTVFASNDARLLLLSLRFDPLRPIDSERDRNIADRLHGLGKAIQRPRCLNRADVKLLEDFGAEADRWSVFISYQHPDNRLATSLTKELQRQGIGVFRDKEALRGGQKWWPTLKSAIGRARHVIAVIGRTTHESVWVQKEIEHAIQKGVNIIPVLAGGDLTNWEHLKELHALIYKQEERHELIEKLLNVTRWRG